MVVFTCGHCGESVNKPKVEKHYLTKCRNRNPNLSCMDCFKDFLGNEYESHTKCITEEERYSGKGFQAKEKKGEKKQNAWVEMLQDVLDEQKDASKNVLRIIETISKHNNTPRKKPKFINFVKNVCGHKTNPKDIDQAWDMIAVKLAALSNNNNKQNETKQNGDAKQNGDVKKNGDAVNGEPEEEEIKDTKLDETEEGQSTNEDEKVNGDTEETKPEKLTKKQRKEEKKRKKYEAELQSAAEVQEESVEETKAEEGKKGKKNRNKSESNTNEEVIETGGKGKKNRNKSESNTNEEVIETEGKGKKNRNKSESNTNEEVIETEGKGKKNRNKSESNTNEEVIETEGKGKNKKRKRQDTVQSNIELNDKIANIENEPIKPKETKKKPKTDKEIEAEALCLHDQNVANGEGAESNGIFNWHSVIISVLQKKGNELPFKRLQKKVLSEYSEYTGDEVDDRIADKFIKKLRSAPNVRVDKNRVHLLED